MSKEMYFGPESCGASVVTPPEANEVRLPAGFTRPTKHRICLSQDGYGRWRTGLPLGLGEYQYNLHVDRLWQDEGEAASCVASSFEWENCVLQVRQP